MRNKKTYEVIIHLLTENGDIEQCLIPYVVYILENNNFLQLQTPDKRCLYYPIHRIQFFSTRELSEKEYVYNGKKWQLKY